MEEIKYKLLEFAKERDWDQFHTPKNLVMAPSQGLDIFRYNIKSNGAEDYLALSKEIIKRSK